LAGYDFASRDDAASMDVEVIGLNTKVAKDWEMLNAGLPIFVSFVNFVVNCPSRRSRL
jgi:hypothetical protein